jgi:hypothetical protein
MNLTGLNVLSSIGRYLRIYSNDFLTSLSGLDNLTFIGEDLWVAYNDALANLMGLNNLTSIGEDLTIYFNNSLTSLTGLENLYAGSIANLHINGNFSLSDCEVKSICEYLASPTGCVDIYSNANGCNNPHQVATACGISLPCLPYGNYYFFTQSEIDNFQTDYPQCHDLMGDVKIKGDDIINLNGLNGVTSIGYLSFGDRDPYTGGGNPLLTSLTGLDSLKLIDGGLAIENNATLTNLTALKNLTSVGRYLEILNNIALNSLVGLENVDSGSINYLWIADNINLSKCEVQSICDRLSVPIINIYIYSNATGCSSQE